MSFSCVCMLGCRHPTKTSFYPGETQNQQLYCSVIATVCPRAPSPQVLPPQVGNIYVLLCCVVLLCGRNWAGLWKHSDSGSYTESLLPTTLPRCWSLKGGLVSVLRRSCDLLPSWRGKGNHHKELPVGWFWSSLPWLPTTAFLLVALRVSNHRKGLSSLAFPEGVLWLAGQSPCAVALHLEVFAPRREHKGLGLGWGRAVACPLVRDIHLDTLVKGSF